MENLVRSSGILLPVTALPSAYGVGSMGKEAIEFLHWLHQAGQRWWQLLPAGHTGYGDSPYQAFSAFAGNPYWIDLEDLAQDGLLTAAELQSARKDIAAPIEYGWLARTRLPLLRRAYSRIGAEEHDALQRFAASEGMWLYEYAMFLARKEQNEMRAWTDWTRWELPSETAIEYYFWLQFHFFRQWEALRKRAHALGIRLLGDLPLYVACDSADVMAHPAWFRRDAVAGVPPDAFSETGQRWGNPLYNWDAMRADGYRWWRARIRMAARQYDAVRMDHLRGLSTYWCIPTDCKTAETGHWETGPGAAFIHVLQAEVPQLQLIGEDLGPMTPELPQFLKACGLPGMRVLQFASATPEGAVHLPASAPEQSVYYIGTHDNETLREWLEHADPMLVSQLARSGGLKTGTVQQQVLCAALQSPAVLCILRMQDVLGLGAESRLNMPGTVMRNWRWKLQTLPPAGLADTLLQWTRAAKRERT